MEGILWKWTNYWNGIYSIYIAVCNYFFLNSTFFFFHLKTGWQTRWFILENGILSYYKSQEEVNQGCKGSVKVSVCQINGKFGGKSDVNTLHIEPRNLMLNLAV